MMKKAMLVFAALFLMMGASAQDKTYEQTWESLDSRPTPSWFKDAKFGIFIHWGIYSVPMWSPKGTYQEWYKYWLDNKKLFGNGDFTGTEIYDYHTKMYGEDFNYNEFARKFKALDYDADAWAKLFEKAGAKYIVLTTKHHDGYALWPSKEASRDYGRPWNSVEVGPKRDLVKEYTDALRKTDIKVGFYISCREWESPLYKPELLDLYVSRHFIPQVKDLVNSYHPDLLWSDGPDNYSDSIWQTKKLFQWIYSESPVKNTIVLNDRWARFTDGKKHGDYYTREYSTHAMPGDKPWEECRGMGFSFSYNLNEDVEDYSSPQGLILTLVNIVSKGGNLLLGIGPNGSGKIPPIMQERLLQMGEWLKVNGEAIYGTHAWKQTEQWSKGDRNWKDKNKHYVGGNSILKQTVDPDPGYAVKEIFFTAKENSVYAILPKLPEGKVILKDVQSTRKTKVTMLGYNKKLQWKQNGKNLVIEVPVISYNEVPCHYAWTLKLENVE